MFESPYQKNSDKIINRESIERYERIRRNKMYRQHNNQERFINYPELRDFLHSLTNIENIIIRLHYQLLGSTTQQDIPNVSITNFENLEKTNVLFSIEKIIHDPADNSVIYQLQAKRDQANKFIHIIPYQRDMLEFCSLMEVKSIDTNNEQTSKVFEGIRYNKPDFNNFLIPITENFYTEPSILNKHPEPKFLADWIDLCRDRWDLVYPDIIGRELALDCWRDGKYFIRRTWEDRERAIIHNESDLDLLEEVQALSMIPNIHLNEPNTEGMLVPVEAMIDFDPTIGTKEEDIFYIGNSFRNYLNALGIKFIKRLSSGRHSGFHYILPIHLDEPLPLISSPPPYQTYYARNKKDILVNSVRHTMEGLVLHYLIYWLKEEKYLKKVTLNPDKRKNRFDVSKNVRFGGRRSLFSSHINTEKVVIPLPEHEISFAHYEYYCSLADITKAKENINDFYEPDYKQISIKKKMQDNCIG
ncbi:MAG: hypothetical protein HeimC3_16680 [Candidatus Heimdallarchaeota archaeon LC_3]|nr:MAG: hypothetical protein HeimC3_16680 [Candidatus Heimdallarchaeota archaeon LC_3]